MTRAQDAAAEQADSHREERVEAALDSIVAEGEPRMHRPWPELLATGTMAGLEVGFGVLALLLVEEATGSHLLAGIAFSIGFLALYLGHSELFTEGFLVPVTVVAAKKATVVDLVRLWVGTIIGNMAGGWLVMWLIVTGFPQLRSTTITAGNHFVTAGLHPRTFCLAVLAGAAMTLLTRMQHGTDSDVAKMLAAVGIAFVLAGGQLFHSILDSLLSFGALHYGTTAFGYLDWLRWFSWVALGNMMGGIGLTTMLRLIRSRRPLAEQRAEAADG